MSVVGSAALAFASCLVAAPGVLWLLRREQILDPPSDRSSHHESTPRGGGLAPAFGCLLAATVVSTKLGGDGRAAILFLAGGMGLVGLIDDLHPLEPFPRLVVQTLVSVAGSVWLGQDLSGSDTWRITFMLGLVVWLIGFVNAFNFMDGINGISVVQVILAGATWWVLGETQHLPGLAAAGLIAAAAAAAFAPFNTPRATMFLGDVGSYFFGAWLATAAVIGLRGGIPPEAVLAPLAVYGADTLLTLLRRVRRGDSWYRPHREHTYQMLVQAGWSHGRTSLVVGVAIIVTTALGALSVTDSLAARGIGDLCMVGALTAYVSLPTMVVRRPGRGSGAAVTT